MGWEHIKTLNEFVDSAKERVGENGNVNIGQIQNDGIINDVAKKRARTHADVVKSKGC